MRHTKIVCTLGPVTSTAEEVGALIEAGLDVARVNASYGTAPQRAAMVETVRRAASRAGKHVAVMVDLQGPKIRVGPLRGGAVTLAPGDRVVITTEAVTGDARRFGTTYDRFAGDVKVGEHVLLADGLLALRVERVEGGDVTCTVIEGGVLQEHKGINLPDTALSTPALTPKDREDARDAVALGADYVALSFVRSARDIADLRALVGDGTRIVAKIERPEALRELDAIVAASDAVIVARGDLGVETPAHEVPLLQKRIIARCNAAAVPVITATQMLESMVERARPTRAEVSDVANAVLDGTDAVMLSEETSVGRHPVEAVRMMAEVCESAETLLAMRDDETDPSGRRPEDLEAAVARSACLLARELRARAIVAMTHGGTTARLLSSRRPAVPILAMTTSDVTARRCALYWGVRALLMPSPPDTDTAIALMRSAALAGGDLRAGDMVIFTAGHPLTQRARTNFMKGELL